jgi:hypothetical protein
VGGDKPIGLAIGIVVVAALVALPAAIVPIFYVLANIHAIIVGTDFDSSTANVGVLFTMLAMTVVLVLLGMAGIVTLIGKTLSPKNRPD